jgi:hypothetical protein
MSRSLSRSGWIPFVTIFLSAVAPVLAQVQGMQVFDNRLEGTKVRSNALVDLTLIAVHKNFEEFPPNAVPVLQVRFFLPILSVQSKREVFVEAAELQDSFHYSMQAKNPGTWKTGDWNVFGPWPTRDVIGKLGVLLTNIGVLAGYRKSGTPPVYLPVDVYSGEAVRKRGAYTFHFITGQDLQSLDVSVASGAGTRLKTPMAQFSCKKQYNPNCKLYAAGSAQSFQLDMAGLPPGEYRIKLFGRIPGNLTPVSLEFVVYHSP